MARGKHLVKMIYRNDSAVAAAWKLVLHNGAALVDNGVTSPRRGAVVTDLKESFARWICDQRIKGFAIRREDEDHISIAGNEIRAAVNFYDLGEDLPPIVELQAMKEGCEDALFFLHFELEDLTRAKELFGEMAEALAEASAHSVTHILLCCTTGLTTTMFANKMNAVAKTLSLAYDFAALPLEEALRTGDDYAAVLLAPQVGHRRNEVDEALREAVVIPVPAKIFGAYDAGAAVRLVMDALQEAETSAQRRDETRIARKLDTSKCVLIITAIHGINPKSQRMATRIAWKVFDKTGLVMEGKVQKRGFEYRDIVDVVASLSLLGCDMNKIDAMGIAVPGSVVNGVASMRSRCIEPFDLKSAIRQRWDVPVTVENNSRAAAVGCYVSQDRYDTLVFHGQRTGHPVGGEGVIVGGHALRGRAAWSGELSPLAEVLSYSNDPRGLAWTPEGMCELVASHLVAASCLVAPEAAFVACDLIPDMGMLRDELAKHLPEDSIPDLIAVDDYRRMTELGVAALCLQEG